MGNTLPLCSVYWYLSWLTQHLCINICVCIKKHAWTNSNTHFPESLCFAVKPTTNSTDGFTEWGPWSPCSKTCGSNVLRVRKRSCFNSSSQSCTGSTSEVKPCFLPKCPDDLALSEDLGINGKSSHNSECDFLFKSVRFIEDGIGI